MDKQELLDITCILRKNEYQYVYRPNDDSYFFLRLVSEDILTTQPNITIIEIGSGSGIVIANIAKLLQGRMNDYFAIDINYDACHLTNRFQQHYKLGIDVINCDGIQNLKFKSGIDILLFNPPYVPTENSELLNAKQLVQKKEIKLRELFEQGIRGDELVDKLREVNLIDSSYAGGEDGMQVTWEIIKSVVQKINQDGVMQQKRNNKINLKRYLFLVQENQIKELTQYLIENGFSFLVLGKQQKYNEIQYVIKYRKIKIH